MTTCHYCPMKATTERVVGYVPGGPGLPFDPRIVPMCAEDADIHDRIVEEKRMERVW